MQKMTSFKKMRAFDANCELTNAVLFENVELLYTII